MWYDSNRILIDFYNVIGDIINIDGEQCDNISSDTFFYLSHRYIVELCKQYLNSNYEFQKLTIFDISRFQDLDKIDNEIDNLIKHDHNFTVLNYGNKRFVLIKFNQNTKIDEPTMMYFKSKDNYKCYLLE